MTDGVPDIPQRFHMGSGLVYEPDRQHTKFRSSGLFVSDGWEEYRLPGLLVHFGVPQTIDSCVTVFHVPSRLTANLIDWVLENHPLDGTPKALSLPLMGALEETVSSATNSGSRLTVEENAIVLQSNPSNGTSSGRTTNGLHFDDPSVMSLRIGVNLGSVDREIYYVPRVRERIAEAAQCDEQGRGYARLADLDLRPVSIRIQPGEGWTLPTTRFLHDGRRAVPLGVSTFILATGRYDRG